MPKYNNREVVINDNDQYYDTIKRRGRDYISQYASYFFNKSFKEKTYTIVPHIWSKGDKLFKLAYQYYGDYDYWWIIALWNYKPTDSHYSYGDEILIPFPPNEIYRELTNG